MKFTSLFLAFAITFSLVFCSCTPSDKNDVDTTSETSSPDTTETEITTEEITTEEITTEPPVIINTVTLIAVGDNLIHGPLVTAGTKFGFDKFYHRIKDTISAADLAIINQESCFTYDASQYSGYPRFASPIGVGEAAIAAGFDVFTLATNHTWDKGEQLILDTLDFFSKRPEALPIGIHETVDTLYEPVIIEKNDIKIALLNFSYGSNRTQQVWWRMNTLSNNNKDAIQTMLQKAEEKADITIVIPHWGVEYKHTPNSYQISWAKFFTENGADIIIGHHPHVVQPMMTVEADNGNTAICYYSLGNFISNQTELESNIGGMASLTIVKENGVTRVENAQLIPTTVQVEKISGTRTYEALLLSDLTPELLQTHYKFKNKTVEDFWNRFNLAATSYPK